MAGFPVCLDFAMPGKIGDTALLTSYFPARVWSPLVWMDTESFITCAYLAYPSPLCSLCMEDGVLVVTPNETRCPPYHPARV